MGESHFVKKPTKSPDFCFHSKFSLHTTLRNILFWLGSAIDPEIGLAQVRGFSPGPKASPSAEEGFNKIETMVMQIQIPEGLKEGDLMTVKWVIDFRLFSVLPNWCAAVQSNVLGKKISGQCAVCCVLCALFASHSLEDGRQVQMHVPQGAAPGSVVQFEPPPPPTLVSAQAVLPMGSSLDSKMNPLTRSIEMTSTHPETRLNIDPPAPTRRKHKPLSDSVSFFVFHILEVFIIWNNLHYGIRFPCSFVALKMPT